MYIDLVVIIVLLVVILFFFRRFSSFVYGFAIIDIFLRLLTFVKNHVPIPELQNLIAKYFPESIAAVIRAYSSGIFYEILIWGYAIMYMIFFSYIVSIFIHKRK